ncbi:MAG TPA: hypothetical protein VIP11_13185 [Gemmatimonadaceae bacterium]
MTRRSLALTAAILVTTASGCIHRTTPFERYMVDGRWTDAAREFTSDSSLRSNERTLYQAALLFGTPGRATYDAAKSRKLFADLLTSFPSSSHAEDAAVHLAMIDASVKAQQQATQRERDLEARIAGLTRETHDLKARIDSAVPVGDSLRMVIARLETERKEREEQLRTLRLELQKLKEIDLKPRSPGAPIKPS